MQTKRSAKPKAAPLNKKAAPAEPNAAAPADQLTELRLQRAAIIGDVRHCLDAVESSERLIEALGAVHKLLDQVMRYVNARVEGERYTAKVMRSSLSESLMALNMRSSTIESVGGPRLPDGLGTTEVGDFADWLHAAQSAAGWNKVPAKKPDQG